MIVIYFRPARRILLNVRLWDRHLQVWVRGARIIKAESGANCVRLDELLFTTVHIS